MNKIFKIAFVAALALTMVGCYNDHEVPEADKQYTDEELQAAGLEYISIEQLKKEGLTSSGSDFLLDHGPEIQSRIKDDQLRRLPLWSE